MRRQFFFKVHGHEPLEVIAEQPLEAAGLLDRLAIGGGGLLRFAAVGVVKVVPELRAELLKGLTPHHVVGIREQAVHHIPGCGVSMRGPGEKRHGHAAPLVVNLSGPGVTPCPPVVDQSFFWGVAPGGDVAANHGHGVSVGASGSRLGLTVGPSGLIESNGCTWVIRCCPNLP